MASIQWRQCTLVQAADEESWACRCWVNHQRVDITVRKRAEDHYDALFEFPYVHVTTNDGITNYRVSAAGITHDSALEKAHKLLGGTPACIDETKAIVVSFIAALDSGEPLETS
jgi:predicted kinase